MAAHLTHRASPPDATGGEPATCDQTVTVRRFLTIAAAREGSGRRLRPSPDVDVAVLPRVPRWLGILRAAAAPETTGDIDALVVGRARQGDRAAFAGIVRHYDARLRALAYRLVRDRDRMDDVLQEVYVKAYRGLPRFKGDSALGTWLYRITYNACLDDLRRRPAVAAVPYEPDAAAAVVDPGIGPADVAALRHDLAVALDRLPPDQRAAVMLVDAYGLDYADAAGVLGVRVGTVASRLSRARAALRDALGGEDWDR
jgi:RNA polymerase sigma-70 factor (ECF subfamily)